MSVTTNKPKIEIKIGNGGVYFYTDPATGKTHTSPGYAGLVQDLEDATTARDRAARQQSEHAQRIADRKADGAARLAELAPRLAAAQAERDRAWSTFRTAALEGGPLVEAFARYAVAFRTAGNLNVLHGDARHQSEFGEERRGNPSAGRVGTLTEALDKLVNDRVTELRATPAEG